MTKKVAVTSATLAFAFTIACSPGFVDTDCESLNRYGSSTWLDKAFCKLGNLL